MIIEYAPIVGVNEDRKTDYTFGFDKILVKINNADYDNEEVLIDLTNIEEGKNYENNSIVKEVRRNSQGSLEVKLLKYIRGDATKEDRFPKPFTPETEAIHTDVEPIFMEEIQPEEIDTTPTSEDLLMLAIADLDFQREEDKLENQLAMAELAETLMGGF